MVPFRICKPILGRVISTDGAQPKASICFCLWESHELESQAGQKHPCLASWRNLQKGKGSAWLIATWMRKQTSPNSRQKHPNVNKMCNSQIWKLNYFRLGGDPRHGGCGGELLGSRSLHQVCCLWSRLWTDCSHSHQEIQVNTNNKN